MNSLTYISRQFDALAAARTPPSTPTTDVAPLPQDGHQSRDGQLKRVSTWSPHTFNVFTTSASTAAWSFTRSQSSPGDVNPEAARLAAALHHIPIPAPKPRPESRRPSVSAQDKPAKPSANPQDLIRRLFFVRVMIALWNILCAAWRSLTGRHATRKTTGATLEEGTDEDEKETEDESKDEKPVTLHLQLPPPTLPPSSPLLPLPPPPPPASPPAAVSHASLPAPLAPHAEPQTLAPASTPFSSYTSRASTPQTTRPRPILQQKTLVLDLDETLIHSTSRPQSTPSGGGMLNVGGFGRKNKGAGHTVEVVLGGRSTVYHVYKRPFVDYFLRKARLACFRIALWGYAHRARTGLGMVHIGYIHRVAARVRGPCDRLAGRRSGDPRPPLLSRGMWAAWHDMHDKSDHPNLSPVLYSTPQRDIYQGLVDRRAGPDAGLSRGQLPSLLRI